MKKFHENLLIVFALGLCALCAWQSYGQTRQRNLIDELNRQVNDKTVAIQGLTNTLQNAQQEISQVDARLTELKTAVKTNELLVAEQKREIHRLTVTSAQLTNEITQYKQAIDDMQGRLKDAYVGIAKQNTAISEITTQRDDLVNKYNESVKDRNDVVVKYNALVEKVEKMQAAGKSDK
jgi:chromosome segregation ATPase